MTRITTVREHLMGATVELLAARGFRGLRMADVAAAAGVSRQTVYNEFGSKEGLVDAVALHTVAEFLTGIADRLAASEELLTGIADAVGYAIAHAAENRLVHSILTGTDAEDLLPLLTTRGLPVLSPVIEHLRDHLRAHRPELSEQDAALFAETGVRLTVSHLLMPTHDMRQAAQTITDVLRRLLEESCS